MDHSNHPAPAYEVSQTPEIAIQQPQGAVLNEKSAYTAQPQPQQQQYIQPGPQLQQQQQPQMAGPGARQPYQTAVPITALGEFPGVIDCPVCNAREMTAVEAETGNTTNAWAAILCICCCLGCIPYLMASLKDVLHKCGHCGVPVARWHRSGRLEPLVHR